MPQFIDAGIFEKDEKNGLPIRKILRKLDDQNQLHQVPYTFADRKAVNKNWYFQRDTDVIQEPKITNKLSPDKPSDKPAKVPKHRDEDYVLDLCDEVLKLKGSRQHKFDILLGDAGTKLPVDIYYVELKLVIEY